MIEFRVLGKPAPQGSKTRMPNGAIVEGKSTKGRQEHKAWRTAVAETAHANRHDTPLDGPLLVRIELRMPRPKARKTALYCDRRPDVDKIAFLVRVDRDRQHQDDAGGDRLPEGRDAE